MVVAVADVITNSLLFSVEQILKLFFISLDRGGDRDRGYDRDGGRDRDGGDSYRSAPPRDDPPRDDRPPRINF